MKTAMIFAAGRGERFKALTDVTPKALCRVQGAPLIEHHIKRLAQAGIERIVINHAHLGGQIRQYLGHGQRFGLDIIYTPEPPGGLETGGGIVNALPVLGQESFIAVNADIYTEFSFAELSLRSSSQAHIILAPKPSYANHGDFGLQDDTVTNSPEHTYTGIACYHPDLFKHLSPGRFSLTPLLRELVAQRTLTGELYHGHWFDIGSPARLQFAETHLQAKK